MHQLYQAIGPRPGDWPQLLEKMLEATTRDFDYMEQMTGLRAMTLIVAADEDIFPPAHAVEMFELLGGARDEQMAGAWSVQLAILPGVSHQTVFMHPAFIALVTRFLDGEVTPWWRSR